MIRSAEWLFADTSAFIALPDIDVEYSRVFQFLPGSAMPIACGACRETRMNAHSMLASNKMSIAGGPMLVSMLGLRETA